MNVIVTKYLGHTPTKPARIVAQASNGQRAIISYPHELNGGEAHAKAAKVLLERLQWPGEWIHGDLSQDKCVFLCNHPHAIRFIVGGPQ